jgi:response regulator RpfG family c-di-GMP phosphodiesterase
MRNSTFSVDTLKEIFDIAKSLSSVLDVDALLKRIGSAGERLLGAEASCLMLLDDDKQTLSFKVSPGEKGGIAQKLKLKIGQGIGGTVAQDRKSLVVNDAAKDPRFDVQMDKITGFVTRSIIGVPLLVENDLIGVMEVMNKKSGVFTDEDRSALESLASLAAVSISNAKQAEDQRNFFVHGIEIFVSAIESKEPKLSGHSWAVAQLSTRIGKHMGLEGQEYRNLYYGALLHDIGLLGIKDGFSLAEGVITSRDREPDSSHPRIGADMVRDIGLLKGAEPVIRHHHENFDGTGYPDGLSGEQIPAGARIVAVAEAVEEMRLSGLPDERVRQLLKLGQETRFDPLIVGICLKECV